ncbi:MAG: electron transfer flavoprotein subunit alpha/FixB family protein [Thermoleophilia bacterium]|nr:electron transfer flavoprotein subunit alpha/FixB family protein [Thermoleophilia bacterium]
MAGTLVVAEHVRGQLRDVTKELVTAAAGLGGPVTVAVIARDPAPLAAAANVPGADEVVAVSVAADGFSADTTLAAVETLVREREPSLILTGFTVDAMGYAPALAARLDLGFASDVVAVRRDGDGLVAERDLYGAKVRAELEFPGHDRVVLMLRPTAWAPAEGAGTAAISELAVAATGRSRHLDYVEGAGESDVDITKADFLLSIGRGVGEKDSIAQFEELAAAMGATLGVSRPLVDAGWMPASRQVGQSGKTVKPKVYLAFGISGAVQHLAGMKSSGTIIAVNTDPEAAIFNVAHFGAVCDIFEVAEALEKLY